MGWGDSGEMWLWDLGGLGKLGILRNFENRWEIWEILRIDRGGVKYPVIQEYQKNSKISIDYDIIECLIIKGISS